MHFEMDLMFVLLSCSCRMLAVVDRWEGVDADLRNNIVYSISINLNLNVNE